MLAEQHQNKTDDNGHQCLSAAGCRYKEFTKVCKKNASKSFLTTHSITDSGEPGMHLYNYLYVFTQTI